MCHSATFAAATLAPERKSIAINDQLQLGAFAFPGQPHGLATPFGRREGGINKALTEIDPAFLSETTHDRRQRLAKGLVGTPKLKPVMHRRLARKTLRQVLPLDARVQNEKIASSTARPSFQGRPRRGA